MTLRTYRGEVDLMKVSQCEKVLQYMEDYGSISTMEAFTDLGVTRLSGRIYDLIHRGYPIVGEMVAGKNRYGEVVHYMRYRMES